MSQHDMDLANQVGAAFRADLNLALAALVGQNNGATEPTTTFPYMFWADTANDILKQRNAADTGWVSLCELSTGTWLGTAATATDVSGGTITNEVMTKVGETLDAPAISGGTLTLDLSAASVFDVALDAAISSMVVSNPFASGTAHGFTLIFTADGTARAVTWMSGTQWPGGTAPTLTSTNAKKDIFTFLTLDGGTSWLGFVAGQSL